MLLSLGALTKIAAAVSLLAVIKVVIANMDIQSAGAVEISL
jgi:hypothetical protein